MIPKTIVGETINILNEKWFTALRDACKPSDDNDAPLDWRRLAAIIYLLSDGDIGKRVVDWEYLSNRLGPDNPTVLPFYDDEEQPTIEIIDRATRWGLFQILGDTARRMGYQGQYLGLASVGANLKFGLRIYRDTLDDYFRTISKLENQGEFLQAQQLEESLPGAAEERAFGVSPTDIDGLVKYIDDKIKSELSNLQEIYDNE